MKIVILKNYEEVSEYANDVMREVLTDKKAVLGLATGSSPLGLYAKMVEDNQNKLTDYSMVTTFNLDEYVGLKKDHRESYYSFMNNNLFSKINVDLANTHLPSGENNLEENCLAYEKLLKQYTIDLQILGIGSNGHIGFNEPGTSFNSETHVVKLKESTRHDNARFFEDLSEDVPRYAITMGLSSILRAKKILLVATGFNKAQAIKDMVEHELTEEIPATILQKHDDVIVVCDEAAACFLTKTN